MDPETVRTITTSAITAFSTLTAAAIVAYFGYRTQKHTSKTKDMEKDLEKRTTELIRAYRHVSAYYQLEQQYSEYLASSSGQSQKTLKSQFRKAVQDKGYDRPEWTSLECEQAISALGG
jgi:hypothetical protein